MRELLTRLKLKAWRWLTLQLAPNAEPGFQGMVPGCNECKHGAFIYAFGWDADGNFLCAYWCPACNHAGRSLLPAEHIKSVILSQRSEEKPRRDVMDDGYL